MSGVLVRRLHLPLGAHLSKLVNPRHAGILVFSRFDRDAGCGLVVVVIDRVQLDLHLAEIGAGSEMLANRLANLDLGLFRTARDASEQ